MGTQMQIGVTAAFNHLTRPQFMIEAAQAYEAAGFHSMWVPEHVMFFSQYASTYPYSGDGRIPGEPEGLLDPFTSLTFVAAHTEEIRLGTGICLVPQRQPVYTARLVADLDYLSGGRVDFGVGVGWLEEEFDALGVPFAARGRRCNEYIQAIRKLWGEGDTSFDGEFVQIPNCHFRPKPVQQPGPPVFFGGESDAALRRVAALGDGWYAFNISPEELAARFQKLDEYLSEHGRSRDDLKIYIGPNSKPINPDTVAGYAELGVEQLVVPVMAGNIDKLKRRIEKYQQLTGMAA